MRRRLNGGNRLRNVLKVRSQKISIWLPLFTGLLFFPTLLGLTRLTRAL